MSHRARSRDRPVRVMQSFGPPRATTNPYIRMLDAALERTPGVEHMRFDRRRALFGRYDALQLHWPETLLGGSTPARALARRAFALALRMRLALTPVAVVRTVHNDAPHEARADWERRFLAWLDRRTDHRILLTEHAAGPSSAPATVIRHGHYRDWFADAPAIDAEPGTLAFVGLVRPYKGVEALLDAFASTADARPDLRLRVAGLPADAVIEREVRARAARDARVELDLRHLPDRDFASSVLRSAGVVLPFLAMQNSGSLLAALSLGRPVLVPRTPTTEELAAEVGPGWITAFEPPLTGDDLRRFAEAAERPPAAPPDLSAREWDDVGAAHRTAFLRAVADRRERRLPR
ncbi:glycosyltransferase [Agrococcus sp. HG114]|uniref:glycosyltransferase n=1 Tax=Agrococcus sp. HG114 TaxID=2969757 RepID=UPI00215B767F|nr:glycosyltransferase [Agrococcus sp. HG114]MCR8670988.1 glycosyltransferase [Agrococcus sp. HG114]